MNHCAIQQAAFSSNRQDIRRSEPLSMSDCRDPVVCPKPRRLGLLNSFNDNPLRFLRWHLSHQSDACETKTGSDVLDLLLTKGGYGCGADKPSLHQLSSVESPIFCGSPPSRVANPLIQDARFGDEKLSPLSSITETAVTPPDLSSPISSARKGGYTRASFGSKPAVRVEGFDCLDGDRRNHSIPALA